MVIHKVVSGTRCPLELPDDAPDSFKASPGPGAGPRDCCGMSNAAPRGWNRHGSWKKWWVAGPPPVQTVGGALTRVLSPQRGSATLASADRPHAGCRLQGLFERCVSYERQARPTFQEVLDVLAPLGTPACNACTLTCAAFWYFHVPGRCAGMGAHVPHAI